MARWRGVAKRYLVLLLGVVLASCAPPPARVPQAAQPASLDGGTTQSVQIYARDDWRDTGIDLVKGHSYRITAEGSWSNGGLCGMSDASGAGGGFCNSDPLGIGAAGQSLIGRIGPKGKVFAVGKLLTMVAPESGRLYLRDYDVISFDNVGSMNVSVEHSRALAAAPRDAGGAATGLVSAAPPPAAQLPAVQPPVAAAPPPVPPVAAPGFTPLGPVQSPLPPPGTGRRVALVVGEGGYRFVPRLDNPPNDAALMAHTLQAAGFELIGGGAQIDLDKAGFDRVIQAFGRRIESADVALFYYAGHGLQVHGTNWLVPVTANPQREADLDFQMVDASLVLKQMQAAGTKLNIVLLDACRNNPFSAGRGLRAAGGGLAQMRAPEGTLISYATQPGSVAADGTGRDSPYTLALARAIQTPGLDIFRLFNKVGLDVKQETGGNQLPWVSNSPISGDFYFHHGAAR